MSRLIYYIWIFTLYPIRPCAYPISPKLRGNLAPLILRYPYPIWLSFLSPLNPSLAPHAYSLLSAYLHYFPYTPFLLSYLVYDIGIFIISSIPSVYLTYIPYTVRLSNPRFPCCIRLSPRRPRPYLDGQADSLSIGIGNAQVSKCAIRVDRRAWLTVSPIVPYMRTARPLV